MSIDDETPEEDSDPDDTSEEDTVSDSTSEEEPDSDGTSEEDTDLNGTHGEDTDRYDVTTWEDRTALDHLAVAVHRLLLRHWEELLVTFAVILLVAQFALAAVVVAQNPWVLGFSVLSVVPALLLVWVIRRFESGTQPIKPMAVTFALGGLFASFAALLDSAPGSLLQSVPFVGAAVFFILFVGPVEETVKWTAVRLSAFDRPTFETALDGAVYGAAAGLGFATIENAIYITRGLAAASQAGTPVLGATFATAAVRSLAGPGHVVYTAFSGYYLGLAKQNPEHRGPIVVKGLLIAALIHGGYDTLSTYLPQVVSFTPVVLFGFIVVYVGGFGLLLYRKLARHRRQATSE